MKAQKIKTLYIKPGSPWENRHIESVMKSFAMLTAICTALVDTLAA